VLAYWWQFALLVGTEAAKVPGNAALQETAITVNPQLPRNPQTAFLGHKVCAVVMAKTINTQALRKRDYGLL